MGDGLQPSTRMTLGLNLVTVGITATIVAQQVYHSEMKKNYDCEMFD